MFPQKPHTLAVFEPGSSRSWGGYDVHCATLPAWARLLDTYIHATWYVHAYVCIYRYHAYIYVHQINFLGLILATDSYICTTNSIQEVRPRLVDISRSEFRRRLVGLFFLRCNMLFGFGWKKKFRRWTDAPRTSLSRSPKCRKTKCRKNADN
jgi:hypothetical protein